MPQFASSIDPNSATFAENRAALLKRIEDFRELEARVRANSERSRPKFEKRGQLLPRDRLELLLDPGAPFLMISTLAGLRMHDDDGEDNIQGGGSIAGIGFVSGRRCLVSATDSGIKGGSVPPMGMKKALRLQEIALENRLPMVTLADY